MYTATLDYRQALLAINIANEHADEMMRLHLEYRQLAKEDRENGNSDRCAVRTAQHYVSKNNEVRGLAQNIKAMLEEKQTHEK